MRMCLKIPSALWHGFLVQGFTLGVHSLDPEPDLSVSFLTFITLNRAVCAKAGVRLAAAPTPE